MKLQTFPRIMLVDMNSFFASVEQQANPFLRGLPVGVAPYHHPTSCLIGTSKEAKALGIKNGISLHKAKKICPNVIVVESEPEKYREVNRQIVRIFRDYTDELEVYSVDEAFLDFRESKLNPLLVGAQIKQRIRQEVGEWLTCSVGIAPNKFMAKLAADLQKPDGLSVVWRENLPEIYRSKKLSDLWGINHGWTKRLEKLGITNPTQLLNYPVQNLISVFGKPGYWLWERVNGLEQDEIAYSNAVDGSAVRGDLRLASSVTPNATAEQYALRHRITTDSKPKSFGHSWVLNFRTTDKQRLAVVIMRLAEKAARRMRREGFMASGMYLSITLVNGKCYHRGKKLKFRIETGLELYYEALKIWEPWNFEENVMHIAVGFTHLCSSFEQLDLFSEKSSKLVPTLDFLNDKYGEFTLRSGLLTKTSDYAPDAIAFGK